VKFPHVKIPLRTGIGAQKNGKILSWVHVTLKFGMGDKKFVHENAYGPGEQSIIAFVFGNGF
jgi:hypothetical protein